MGHTEITKGWSSSDQDLFSEVDPQTSLQPVEPCEIAVDSSSGIASGLANLYFPWGP